MFWRKVDSNFQINIRGGTAIQIPKNLDFLESGLVGCAADKSGHKALKMVAKFVPVEGNMQLKIQPERNYFLKTVAAIYGTRKGLPTVKSVKISIAHRVN